MKITFALLLAAFAGAAPAADLMLQTGSFEHDGERIYYESVGSGDAIVLTHGAGGTHGVWYQQVPVLAQKYRVITWDQRGFGRSTNERKQAGPAAFAGDLGALLDHLNIRAAHLVGQSMGGWTVLGFALTSPDRVRSLVLADTFGGIQLAAPSGPPRFNPSPDTFPIHKHPGLYDGLGARDPAKAFLYRELGSPAPEGLLQTLSATTYGSAEAQRLRMPVLMIVGEHDAGFPVAAVRALATKIQGAQVAVIPGAGHSPYFETPDAWNTAYSQFLSGLPRR